MTMPPNCGILDTDTQDSEQISKGGMIECKINLYQKIVLKLNHNYFFSLCSISTNKVVLDLRCERVVSQHTLDKS